MRTLKPAAEQRLKERRPHERVLRLAHTFPTRLQAGALWSELLRAIGDSRGKALWVHELSRARTLSPSPAAGADLEVRYLGGRPVHYRLTGFEPQRRLRYWTLEDHPLTGGGLLELLPTAEGTALRWETEYSGALPLRLFFRGFWAYFQRRLRMQLRQLERGRAARRPGRRSAEPVTR